MAPMLHMWYCKVLPSIVSKLSITTKTKEVFTKLAFDQTIFASTLLAGFYIFLNCLTKRSIKAGIE